MKLIRMYHADPLNGEGLREVLFLSGCEHHCLGCFSPETWDPDMPEAHEWTLKDEEELFKNLEKPFISGVTFSGGDPFSKWNVGGVRELCIRIKEKFPEKTIWLYTGYTWESIMHYKDTLKHQAIQYDCLKYIDVLCEGPFIESLKSPTKPWVGSENQRVIDVRESLKEGKICPLDIT